MSTGAPAGHPLAVAAWILSAVLACDGVSPASPGEIDLTGVWAGALPVSLPSGDWSFARVSLVQRGANLTGELASRDGARYPLTGTVRDGGATLTVGDLPGTSTCGSVQLLVTRVESEAGRPQRLVGEAMGRCFGTVSGSFYLQRES